MASMSRPARPARTKAMSRWMSWRAPSCDGTVFNRTELHAADGDPEEGDSYSVVHLSKSTQTSGSLKVLVVKTLDWDTAGIRDLRDRDAADGYSETDCVIGRELAYPAFTDAAGHAAGPLGPGGRPAGSCTGTRTTASNLRGARLRPRTRSTTSSRRRTCRNTRRARSSPSWSRRPPRVQPTPDG